MPDPDRTAYTLLGPVRVWSGGVERDAGPAVVRAVLALLLLSRGGRAGVGEIVRGVWGERPPLSAGGLVRTHIHRLRKALGPMQGGGERIVWSGDTYTLRFGPRDLDLSAFEQLAARGRATRDTGDPDAAAALLREALGLWTGPALAGVPGPFAAAQRARLESMRLTAAADWLGCVVDTGRYTEAAAELAELTAAHPLEERLRELQMRALYGAGRRAEALAVYRETRRLLRVELGVEPTRGLQRLHARVLAADPQLTETPAPVRRAAPALPHGSALTSAVPAAAVHGPASTGAGAAPHSAAPAAAAGSSALGRKRIGHVEPHERGVDGHEGGGVALRSTAAHGGSGPAAHPARSARASGAIVRPQIPTPRHPVPGDVEPARQFVRGTPEQLPAAFPRFVGREYELSLLTAGLSPGSSAAGGTVGGVGAVGGFNGAATAIRVVFGMPGVGKTALAVQAAHLLKSRFPDGQLYVDLRGGTGDGAVAPFDALGDFLRALGVPPEAIPGSVEARAALLRGTTAGRRLLLVLDDAQDAEQVRPLLPAAPGCLSIVTSRHRLSRLAATHQTASVRLAPFEEAEARSFLTGALGPGRTAGQADAAGEIIDYCGGLPLALSVVAAHAARRPGARLSEISAPLRSARDALPVLTLSRDASVTAQAALTCAYQALDPSAARLLRLLALHPGPQITAIAAAVTAGLEEAGARNLLAELVSARMLDERAPGRFAFHDLIHAFAADQSREQDTDRDRAAAFERLIEYYVLSAHTADRLLAGAEGRAPGAAVPARPQAVAESFATADEARAWLRAEYAVLVAAAKWATVRNAGSAAWRLSRLLGAYPARP